MSSIISILMLIIVYIILPILIFITVLAKKKLLENKYFKLKLGRLWIDLKIKRIPRFYYLWNWTRRLVYFSFLVLLTEKEKENS